MRKIVLEVPFLYEMTFVGPRKRNPETAAIKSTMAVEISVLDDAEMPVAFRWQHREDEPVEDVRWDGRVHYVRELEHVVVEKDLQALVYTGGDTPLAKTQIGEMNWRVRGRDFEQYAVDEIPPGRWVSDDREARAKAVETAAQACIFCKDGFWTTSPQPLWVCDNSSSFASLTPGFATDQVLKRYVWSPFWAPDDAKRAEREASGKGSRKHFYVDGMIEVVRPEAITLHIPSAAVVSTVGALLDKEKGGLHAASEEFMIAYARVRDAVASWAPSGGRLDDITLQLASCFHALLPVSEFGVRNSQREVLGKALALWKDEGLAVEPIAESIP